MKSIGKIVASVVVASWFAAAGEALAQEKIRGCFEGNPLMKCPLGECLALEAAVKAPAACPTQESPLKGCTKISGCNNLRQARQRWLTCYEARTIFNQRCWDGGDFEHQQKAAEAIQNVASCDARIALPEPTGCADPCP